MVDRCGKEFGGRDSLLHGAKARPGALQFRRLGGTVEAAVQNVVDRRRFHDLPFHQRGQGQANGLRHSGHYLLHDHTHAEEVLGGRADHEVASGARVGNHGFGWYVPFTLCLF